MTFDEVQGKIDAFREKLTRLERIPQGSFEEFVSDFRNVESTLYLLQTAIQAVIDVGAHLVARLGLATPRRSVDVFERLEEAGRLAAGSSDRLRRIIAFRNRVVHLYDRIDERTVYRILTENRRDLVEILDQLLAIDTGEL